MKNVIFTIVCGFIFGLNPISSIAAEPLARNRSPLLKAEIKKMLLETIPNNCDASVFPSVDTASTFVDEADQINSQTDNIGRLQALAFHDSVLSRSILIYFKDDSNAKVIKQINIEQRPYGAKGKQQFPIVITSCIIEF